MGPGGSPPQQPTGPPGHDDPEVARLLADLAALGADADPGRRGDILYAVAQTHFEPGRNTPAAAAYADAGHLLARASRHRDAGRAYRNAAVSINNASDPTAAAGFYQLAAQHAAKAGDAPYAAECLGLRGAALRDAGQPHEAAEAFQEAADRFRTHGALQRAGVCVDNAAAVLHQAGEHLPAVRLFAAAAADFDAAGRPPDVARCRMNVGVCLAAAGHLDQAVDALVEVAAAADSAGDPARAAACFLQLAWIRSDQDDPAGQAQAYQEAAARFDAAGDAAGAAKATGMSADTLWDAGHWAAAEGAYRDAVARHTAIGEADAAARNKVGMTLARARRLSAGDDLAAAAEAYQEAESLAVETSDPTALVALCARHAAEALHGAGNHAGAAEGFLRAAALYDQADATDKATAALGNAARLFAQSGALGRGAEVLRRVVSRHAEAGDLRRAADEGRLLGRLLADAGELDDAVAALAEAAGRYDTSGDPAGTGETFLYLGTILRDGSEAPAQAAQAFADAAARFDEANDPPRAAQAAARRAGALRQATRHAEADEAYRDAQRRAYGTELWAAVTVERAGLALSVLPGIREESIRELRSIVQQADGTAPVYSDDLVNAARATLVGLLHAVGDLSTALDLRPTPGSGASDPTIALVFAGLDVSLGDDAAVAALQAPTPAEDPGSLPELVAASQSRALAWADADPPPTRAEIQAAHDQDRVTARQLGADRQPFFQGLLGILHALDISLVDEAEAVAAWTGYSTHPDPLIRGWAAQELAEVLDDARQYAHAAELWDVVREAARERDDWMAEASAAVEMGWSLASGLPPGPATAVSWQPVLDLVIPAALAMDSARFQFTGQRRRWLWARAHAGMHVALSLAEGSGDGELLADLIETQRVSGRLAPWEPDLAASARSLGLDLLADVEPAAVAVGDTDPARRDRPGCAQTLGGVIGTGDGDVDVPVRAPRWIQMPDGRLALERYHRLAVQRYGRSNVDPEGTGLLSDAL